MLVAATGAGAGSFCSVQEVRGSSTAQLGYGLKAVRTTPPDRNTFSQDAEDFLRLNGGRLGHPTRGFWRDADGRSISGTRAAQRAARRQRRGGQDPEWHATSPELLSAAIAAAEYDDDEAVA